MHRELVHLGMGWSQEDSGGTYLIANLPFGELHSFSKADSAASMPVFMAVWVPLTLGTLMKPAVQPINAPPGKARVGRDYRASIREGAWEREGKGIDWEREKGERGRESAQIRKGRRGKRDIGREGGREKGEGGRKKEYREGGREKGEGGREEEFCILKARHPKLIADTNHPTHPQPTCMPPSFRARAP